MDHRSLLHWLYHLLPQGRFDLGLIMSVFNFSKLATHDWLCIQFEIRSRFPPSNGPVTQFLRQHLFLLVPRHSHGPSVVEVAPGCKVTVTRILLPNITSLLICTLQRVAVARLPEYKKVDNTRHPSGHQPGVPLDTESSDIDSLPDVHWCRAFLCYYSCWSCGRLRMLHDSVWSVLIYPIRTAWQIPGCQP